MQLECSESDTSYLFLLISSSALRARRSRAEDVLCALGSPGPLWPLVLVGKVVVDRGLKIIDAGIATPPDAPCGDLGEEEFHEVEP